MTDVEINWKECSVDCESNKYTSADGTTAGSVTFQFIPERLAYFRSVWDKKNGYSLLTEDEYDELDDLGDWIIDNEVTIKVNDVVALLMDFDIHIDNYTQVTADVVSKLIEDKLHGNQNAHPDLWSFVYDIVWDNIEEYELEDEED